MKVGLVKKRQPLAVKTGIVKTTVVACCRKFCTTLLQHRSIVVVRELWKLSMKPP